MRKTLELTQCLMAVFLIIAAIGFSTCSKAGVGLGATRLIFPGDQTQAKMAVINNKDNSSYLIQSWVENIDGDKDGRFIITPPLFAMHGKKENSLRIINGTNDQLPQDRESLFWLNVKAIPSMDESSMGKNSLQVAIINRIKLYYRPSKLSLPPEKAPKLLSFSRSGLILTLSNPTPYYLTVTNLKAGTRELEGVLVPPMGKTSVKLPADAGSSITYQTINDYGALTPIAQGVQK